MPHNASLVGPERVCQLLLDWTREHGHGITFVELREAMLVQHPETRSNALGCVLYWSVREGVIVRVGGRKGFTQYAHRDYVVPPRSDDHAVRGMLDAVYAAVAQYGRPASTREITLVALARGVSLPGPDHARSYLKVLERPTMLSADGQTREPKIVRTMQRGSSGMHYNFWAPVDAGMVLAHEVVPPENHTGIVRLAIAEAERELGRPVTRRDIVRWACVAKRRAEPVSEAARLLNTGHIGPTLCSALRKSRQKLHTRGVITPVTNQFTGVGLAQKRYTLRDEDDPMLPMLRRGCLMEDAFDFYRPAAELDGIAGLNQSSYVGESQVGQIIGAARRIALFRSLSEALGQGWEAGLPSFQQSVATRERWVAELYTLRQEHGEAIRGAGGESHGYNVEIRQAHQNLIAACAVLDASESQSEPLASRPVRILDHTTAVTAESVMVYLDVAARMFGYGEDCKRNLWLRVRRVPNLVDAAGRLTGRERRRPTAGGPPWRWGVDRVDALLALCDAVGLPRASAAVGQARLLLGHVVRDIHLFRECLAACPPSARATRRAIVLALSLLGDRMTLGELILDPADPADVTYACLAAVFVDLESAEALILQIDEIAQGAARTVSAAAHRRVRAGHLFAMVG